LFVFLSAPFFGQGHQLAQAQSPAGSRPLPDTVVVTASRLPEAVRRTGRRVTVWTAQDIAAQPALSLDEVLRSASGVELQTRGGLGMQSDYTLRGSSFKGVLLLLDGVPLNDPQTGHYISDFPVPLSAVARIEVLRGPATALYGPDAVGGAIHVFTHTGLRAAASPTGGWKGEAGSQYGAHALYDLDASVRRQGRETTVRAATTWQGSRGEPIYDDSGTRATSENGPLRTDFERQAHTFALRRTLGSASLYARAGMDRRDFNAYHFYTDFDSDRARSDNRTYWVQARLRSPAQQRTRWSAQVAAKQHEGLYTYAPAFGPGARDYSRKLHAQAHASRHVTDRLTLTGGASGAWRGIESATMGDHADRSGGAFLSGRWQAAQRLWINGSGRIDYDDAYGFEATPQVSLSYTREAFTLRTAAARAVRAPTYTERYIDTEVAEPAGNLGNPDLDTERAWSYEAGADVYPLPGLTLHGTAFYRDTQNLIDYAQRPGEDLFVARNILSAQHRGLELEAKARSTLGPVRLHLTSAYTFLDATLSADRAAQHKYALASARHLLQGAARVTGGGATLGLRGLWKDRRARPSYGVLHGRLAYQWPLGDTRLGLSLEVRNLFDSDYADVFDAPMPRRWWIVGLQLRR
jgi:outer membrane cobalamin receptor